MRSRLCKIVRVLRYALYITLPYRRGTEKEELVLLRTRDYYHHQRFRIFSRNSKETSKERKERGKRERKITKNLRKTERIRCICCRKVFRFMVELSAGRLGGAVDAVLRAELVRRSTQAVQPAHRSSAHLTIEILSIDSRLCLAEDDHPLLRHGLLSLRRAGRRRNERSSGDRRRRRRSIENHLHKRIIRVRAHRAHVTRQTTHVAQATRHARFPPVDRFTLSKNRNFTPSTRACSVATFHRRVPSVFSRSTSTRNT